MLKLYIDEFEKYGEDTLPPYSEDQESPVEGPTHNFDGSTIEPFFYFPLLRNSYGAALS